MSKILIFKEPREPLTWRHGVFFVYWVIIILPAVLIIVLSAAGEHLEASVGKVRSWANPRSYGRFRDA